MQEILPRGRIFSEDVIIDADALYLHSKTVHDGVLSLEQALARVPLFNHAVTGTNSFFHAFGIITYHRIEKRTRRAVR